MNAQQPSFESKVWTLAELLGEAGIACTSVDWGNVPITALCDDSRAAVSGSLFVAIKGDQSDGHDYIEQAVSAGASAVVAQQKIELPLGVPLIVAEDTHKAIANLASAFYGLRKHSNTNSSPEPQALACAESPSANAADRASTHPAKGAGRNQSDAIKLIGITGTNGKTTVAWLVRAILSYAKHKCALFGTIEYDLGDHKMPAPLTTPSAIDLCKYLAQARRAGASHAILEVSSHALSQQRAAGLSFDVGVFTNLSGDHLDYHGSMDAYWRAKRMLFESLSESAVAIVNYDDPAADLMASGIQARVVRYGLAAKQLDVGAQVIHESVAGSRFQLTIGRNICDVNTSLLGMHNIANAAAAAAVADVMGIPLEVTKEALEAFQGTPGRLERVISVDSPIAVFVDYAHTDDALRNVLAAVKPLTSGQLISVFGCGGDRDTTKRPRMAEVAHSLADEVVVTSDNPRTEDPLTIIEDIIVGFGSTLPRNVTIEPDRRLAIGKAIELAQPGDTVLIAGKGHENYQLVGDKVLEFDDATVARDCLERLVTDSAKL